MKYTDETDVRLIKKQKQIKTQMFIMHIIAIFCLNTLGLLKVGFVIVLE